MVQPPSYWTVTKGCSPEAQKAGVWSWPCTSINGKVKNQCNYNCFLTLLRDFHRGKFFHAQLSLVISYVCSLSWESLIIICYFKDHLTWRNTLVGPRTLASLSAQGQILSRFKFLKKEIPKQNWVVYHSNSVFQKTNLLLQMAYLPLYHISSTTV
jgi:hypothetical protein